MKENSSVYSSTVFGSSSFDAERITSGHTNRVTGLIWMHTSCIVSCSYDGSMKVWDLLKPESPCVRRVRVKGAAKIESLLRISAILFSSYQAATIDVWNLRRMCVIRSISIQSLVCNPIFEVCMLFNSSKILINTSRKDEVFVLDFLSGNTHIAHIEGFPSRLYSFIALDHEHFATSEDKISIFRFTNMFENKTETRAISSTTSTTDLDLEKQDSLQTQVNQLIRTISYTKRGYDELSIVKLTADTIVAGSMHGFIFIANWRDGSILNYIYKNGPQVKTILLLHTSNFPNSTHSEETATQRESQSPTQQIVTSINRDKSLQIWNVSKNEQIQTFFFDRDPHLSISGPHATIISADKIRKEIEIRRVHLS